MEKDYFTEIDCAIGWDTIYCPACDNRIESWDTSRDGESYEYECSECGHEGRIYFSIVATAID